MYPEAGLVLTCRMRVTQATANFHRFFCLQDLDTLLSVQAYRVALKLGLGVLVLQKSLMYVKIPAAFTT